MRSIAIVVVVCASACTPLRPLDGDDDAGETDRDVPDRDAGAVPDAPAPDLDASGPDAFGADAWAPDTWAPDAGAPDAWSPDAREGLDAWAPDAYAPDAWVSTDPITPSTRGAVVFSEIMVSPHDGDRAEWVEIYNPSAVQAYELRGCTLDGLATSVMITSSVRVPPRTYTTLAASAMVPFPPDYVYGTGTFILEEARDRVALTCRSVSIDEVIYEDSTFPLVRYHSIMASSPVLGGPDPATDNDSPVSWCSAPDTARIDLDYGTPGALNNCPPAG